MNKIWRRILKKELFHKKCFERVFLHMLFSRQRRKNQLKEQRNLVKMASAVQGEGNRTEDKILWLMLVLPLQSSEQRVAYFCSKRKSLSQLICSATADIWDFSNSWFSQTLHRSGRSHLSPYYKAADPRWDKKGYSLKIHPIPLSFPFPVLHLVKGKHQGYKLPQKLQEGKHFQQSLAPNPRSITLSLSWAKGHQN